jgi:HK97 family phage major capsid protein
MPYMIQKENETYCVHKENADGTAGEKINCHDTEEKAKAQMRALYAAMDEEKTLTFHGESIKALGNGKVAGYLVRFSTDKDPDVEEDFFDKSTDLGITDGSTLPVYYQHGMDERMGVKSIGRGTIKLDDVGAWMEAQLNMRDEYEKAIYQLAEQGKLGWSSGAAGHLVEREQIGKSYHIKTWVIAEASLTPTPAEPRNNVTPIKSLITPLSVDTEEAVKTIEQTTINEEVTMTEDEIKAMLESVADSAIKKYAESKEPEVKAGYQVDVVEDEADKAARLNPFKSAGEFLKAVRLAELQPATIDKRLLPMKATGLNEAIPSDGGFLVQQDIAGGILQNMWGVGGVLSRFPATPVQGNGMVFNVLDESSRADGYRGGGVQGYWLAEAAEKTKSKPKFRQLSLKLKKVAALCYATDELLEDAGALEAWLTNEVPNELRFQVEQTIINGNGVGKPLGILQSPALLSLARVDANEIDATDVANMWAHRYAGANDYVWFVSSTIFPQLVNLTIGQVPMYFPPGGLGGMPYGTLLGKPVIETEYNPSLGILGDIILAAPSQYKLISKGGVQAASSIHVKFTTDEMTFRWVYRVDGAPSWNSTVASYYASSDTMSPFVALTASS